MLLWNTGQFVPMLVNSAKSSFFASMFLRDVEREKEKRELNIEKERKNDNEKSERERDERISKVGDSK